MLYAHESKDKVRRRKGKMRSVRGKKLERIDKKILFYIGILLLIILISVMAPILAPYNPNQIDMTNKLAIPTSHHWLGTDQLGRDLLSRVLYGGRLSILVAVTATCISMLIGLLVGLMAGYFGGWVDTIVTLCSNILQGLPGMTMMIALIGIMGPGSHSLILALVLTSWVSFSRFVRGEVMKVKQENYIEALKCFGASSFFIMAKGILPNICGNCFILFTTRIGRVVLSVSGLSFLGIGIQPPTPDWGSMINEARRYFRGSPHLLLAPGLCIILFALTSNLLGDALRDKYDVKHEGVKEW